jgi:group I intron endonuclease
MTERISGIYCIRNTINGKAYVGKSVNIPGRWRWHRRKLRTNLHDSAHLQLSWNMYGENSFEFLILEQCDNSCLNERETFYIKMLDSRNIEKGYNLTDGGDGLLGMKRSDETKRKLSEYNKANPSRGNLGRSHSVEAREKISNSRKGKPSNNKGLLMTAEQKEKISKAKKGKSLPPFTEDHKRKISESGKGKHPEHISEEHKKKISESGKGKKHVYPKNRKVKGR